MAYEFFPQSGANGAKRVHQLSLGSPALGTNTAVHAATTLTDAAQTVSTSITNPDVPRNLVVKGNASGMAGNVVFTGKNAEGVTITETIALNGSSAVAGNKAFAEVTSYTLPAKTNGSGDTVSVGVGSKLAIGYRLSRNTIQAAYLNGTLEGTAPTVATSSSAVESNTVALNSALDGNPVIIDVVPT